MIKIIQFEFRKLLRKPLWLSMFLITILISIVLPRANITGLEVLAGMVYFVMIMSLVLGIYGAETARIEQKEKIEETIMVTPNHWFYSLGKIIYWGLLSLLLYIIFYGLICLYIGLKYNTLSWTGIQGTLEYTFLCWYIPFFFSIILGYVIFKFLSNIYGYVLYLVIWFLTMPYNSMLGIIPRKISGWLITGDPNLVEIFSTHPLESMEVNPGFYVQRIYMFILVISLYIYTKYRRRARVRRVVLAGVIIAFLIPLLSPYSPYITITSNIYKTANSEVKITNSNQSEFKYRIRDYTFNIHHGASDHSMEYRVEMNILAENKHISLALLHDFKVQKATFNGISLDIKRGNEMITVTLPESEGKLSMDISTSSFLSVGPSTLGLIATSAWYPMHPLEALNPYNNAVKEKYKIYWKSNMPNPIISNLKQVSADFWEGEEYGPTLFMGKFSKHQNLVFPNYLTEQRILNINKGLEEIIKKYNKNYNTTAALPDHIYFVDASVFRGMQANPDDVYVYPLVYPNQDIKRIFYPDERSD